MSAKNSLHDDSSFSKSPRLSYSAMAFYTGVASIAYGAPVVYDFITIVDTDTPQIAPIYLGDNLQTVGAGNYLADQYLYFRTLDSQNGYISLAGLNTLTGLQSSNGPVIVHNAFSAPLYNGVSTQTFTPYQSGQSSTPGTIDTHLVFEATNSSVTPTGLLTYSVNVPLQIESASSIEFATGPQQYASTINLYGALTGAGTVKVSGLSTLALKTPNPGFTGVIDVGATAALDISQPTSVSGLTGSGVVNMTAVQNTTPSTTLTLVGTSTNTLSTKLQGSAYDRVVKSGSGTLAVSNSESTYAGGTWVQSGVLQITGSSSLNAGGNIAQGPLGTATVLVDGSSTVFDLNGQILHNAVVLSNGASLRNSSITANAVLQAPTLKIQANHIIESPGSYELIIQSNIIKDDSVASGTALDLNIQKGKIRLTGTNTFEGSVKIGEGVTIWDQASELSIESANAFGGSSPVKIYRYGILHFDVADATTIAQNLESAGKITYIPYAEYDAQTDSVQQMTLSGTIKGLPTAPFGQIEVGAGGRVLVSGVIENSSGTQKYGLIKSGFGDLLLNGENTFTGQIVATDGQCIIGPTGSITPETSLLIENGTLDISQSSSPVEMSRISASGGVLKLGAQNFSTDSNNTDIPGGLIFAADLQGTGKFHKKGVEPLTFMSTTSSFDGIIEIDTNSQLNLNGVLQARSVIGSGSLDIAANKYLTLTGSATNALAATLIGDGGVSIAQAVQQNYHIASSSNTYSGGTQISGDRVLLDASSQVHPTTFLVTQGPLGKGSIEVLSTGILDLNGQTLDNDIQLTGILSNSSALADSTLSEHSILTLKAGHALKSESAAGKELIIRGSIVDDSPITVVPLHIHGGQVQIASSNAFTHGTYVESGTLNLTGLSDYANEVLVTSPIGVGSLNVGSSATTKLSTGSFYNLLTLAGTFNITQAATILDSAEITLQGNTSEIFVDDNASGTVSSKLTGAARFIKGGLGALTLTNTHSDYTLGTKVAQGTLILDGMILPSTGGIELNGTLDVSAATTGTVLLNDVTGNANGVLKIGNRSASISLSASRAYEGTFVGTGSVAIEGSGFTYTLSGDNSNYAGSISLGDLVNLALTGNMQASNITGQTGAAQSTMTIALGKDLKLYKSTGLAELHVPVSGAGSITVDSGIGARLFEANIHSGGTNVVAGTAYVLNGLAVGTGVLQIANAGTVDCSGCSLSSQSRIDLAGAIKNDNDIVGPGQLTVERTSAIASGIVLTGVNARFTGTGHFNVAGIISGDYGLAKNGTGTLILNAVNTYIGPTVINQGTLKINGIASIASSSYVQANAKLDLSSVTGSSVSVKNLRGSSTGQISFSDKALTLHNTEASTYAGSFDGIGTITHTGSRITLAGDGSNFNKGLVVNGPLSISNMFTVSSLTGTTPITIDSSGWLAYFVEEEESQTLNLGIEGAGQFRKTGDGALSLQVANTLTGRIDILGGVLKVDHASAVSTVSGIVVDHADLDINGHDVTAPIYMKNTQFNTETTLLNTSVANNKSIISTLHFYAPQSPAVTTYTMNTADGDIEIDNIVFSLIQPTEWEGVPSNLVKTGSHTLILGDSISLPQETGLSVQEGAARIRGNMAGAVVVSHNANAVFEHTSQEIPKVCTAEFSGAGTVSFLGGNFDYTGTLSASNVLIGDQGTYFDHYYERAIVRVTESFVPTGNLQIEGVLEANIQQNTTWNCSVSGTGALKKYGLQRLTLTGDLSEFSGGIQVYEGLVVANETWNHELEVLAGGTLFADVHNAAGREAYVGGNILGARFVNNGDVYLGNDNQIMQILTATEISGEGHWYMDGSNKVRVTAQSQNNTLASVAISSGELTLSGAFQSGQGNSGEIAVWQGGRLLLDAGSSYTGTISVAGGELRNLGLNVDRDVELSTVNVSFGGELDIGSQAINEDPNSYTTRIANLSLSDNAKIHLRPALMSQVADAPLLEVTSTFDIAQLHPSNYYTSFMEQGKDSAIVVIPQGRPETAQEQTFNLLRLGSSQLRGNTGLKAQILSMLQVSPIYDMLDADFNSDGMLQCTLKTRSVEEIFNDTQFSEMSPKLKSLARQILSQRDNENAYTRSIYDQLINAQDPEEMNRIVNQFSPVMTSRVNRALLTRAGQHAVSAGQAIRVRVNTGTIQRWAEKSDRALLERAQQGTWMGSNLVGRHIAQMAMGSSDEARLRTYQSIDLKGLAFSSDVSYSHQTESKESESDPGTTQSRWAQSVGLTYSENKQVYIGAFVETAKNNIYLNANQDSKTAHMADRTNTIGALWLYQSQQSRWYSAVIASYGQHNYKGERTWLYPIATDEVLACEATQKFKGYELYAFMETGYKYDIGSKMTLQPYMNASVTRQSSQAFSESAVTTETQEPNSYGLNVPAQVQTTQSYGLGLEWLAIRHIQDQPVHIMARTGWTTQKQADSASTFTYALQGDPDHAYTEETPNKRYNALDLNVGVYTIIKKNMYINMLYTGSYDKYNTTHTAMVSMEYYIGA